MTSPSRTYAFLVGGAFIWCALILFPVVQAFHYPVMSAIAGVVDRAFSTVCHQIDSRSFHIMGIRLAVCGRCASIYGGFLAGILVWRFAARKRPRNYVIWWLSALLPMLIDVFLDSTGIYTGGNISRALTGGWFGAIAGVIISPLFIQACAELASSIIHQPTRAYESTTE